MQLFLGSFSGSGGGEGEYLDTGLVVESWYVCDSNMRRTDQLTWTELYLRRPPSANEQYRLDRMLQAAAERGVKVNIIVYKEVAAILTCECGTVLMKDSTLTRCSMFQTHQNGPRRAASKHRCLQTPRSCPKWAGSRIRDLVQHQELLLKVSQACRHSRRCFARIVRRKQRHHSLLGSSRETVSH